MIKRSEIKEVKIIDATVKYNLKKRLKPINIEVKQNLLQLRLKRWSIYKNGVGCRDYTFKPTYYELLCKELILLKYHLVKLREKHNRIIELNNNFKFSMLKFIVSNKFYNISDFSFIKIWEVKKKYSSLKNNRYNSVNSMIRYNSFIKKLQKI